MLTITRNLLFSISSETYFQYQVRLSDTVYFAFSIIEQVIILTTLIHSICHHECCNNFLVYVAKPENKYTVLPRVVYTMFSQRVTSEIARSPFHLPVKSYSQLAPILPWKNVQNSLKQTFGVFLELLFNE